MDKVQNYTATFLNTECDNIYYTAWKYNTVKGFVILYLKDFSILFINKYFPMLNNKYLQLTHSWNNF